MTQEEEFAARSQLKWQRRAAIVLPADVPARDSLATNGAATGIEVGGAIKKQPRRDGAEAVRAYQKDAIR